MTEHDWMLAAAFAARDAQPLHTERKQTMTDDNTPSPKAGCGCAAPSPKKAFSLAAAIPAALGVASVNVSAHVGCIFSGLLALAGPSAASLSGGASLAVSAGFSAAGLAFWKAVRWNRAGRAEKAVAIGGTLAGFACAAALNLTQDAGAPACHTSNTGVTHHVR